MPQLRLHRDEHSELDPIPFPNAPAGRRGRRDPVIREAERSLEEVQRHLDTLAHLLEDQWRIDPGGDDQPRAA